MMADVVRFNFELPKHINEALNKHVQEKKS